MAEVFATRLVSAAFRGRRICSVCFGLCGVSLKCLLLTLCLKKLTGQDAACMNAGVCLCGGVCGIPVLLHLQKHHQKPCQCLLLIDLDNFIISAKNLILCMTLCVFFFFFY